MNPKVLQWLKRLEALSTRERVLAVLGLPVVLSVVFEGVVFDQLRRRTVDAGKQEERQRNQVTELQKLVAALPANTQLPAPDQLRAERDNLRREVQAAAALTGPTEALVNWGQVVRGSVQPGSGVALQSLRTAPPQLVFSPSDALKAAAAASAPAAAAKAASATASGAAAGPTLYRHRAELTLAGPLPALLDYVQTLQRLPGDLRWERMQLASTQYPLGTLQLTLYTLSQRPETPFN